MAKNPIPYQEPWINASTIAPTTAEPARKPITPPDGTNISRHANVRPMTNRMAAQVSGSMSLTQFLNEHPTALDCDHLDRLASVDELAARNDIDEFVRETGLASRQQGSGC